MLKNKVIRKMFLIFLFVLGLIIALYPFVSQEYYRLKAKVQIDDFDERIQKIENNEISRRMRLATAYNQTLDPSKLLDPYTQEEKEGIAEYARMLEVEEKIGYVTIPAIEEKIPIYAGTKESVLQKGAGHLEGTSLPIGGINTHTVITAHRGLPTATLFRKLDKLKEGDLFFITNIKEKLVYEVKEKIVVEPHDFEPVLVRENKDYATLLTCTPYMLNTHRLLVRGERVEYSDDLVLKSKRVDMRYKKYFYISLLVILVLLLLIVSMLRQNYKNNKYIVS